MFNTQLFGEERGGRGRIYDKIRFTSNIVVAKIKKKIVQIPQIVQRFFEAVYKNGGDMATLE